MESKGGGLHVCLGKDLNSEPERKESLRLNLLALVVSGGEGPDPSLCSHKQRELHLIKRGLQAGPLVAGYL